MASKNKKDKGVSLAKGPVGITGIILLALGLLGFIAAGDAARRFGGISIPDGTVNGGSFLGFEANGWTNLLLIGAGALLLFASPLHWAAKSLSLIVGLVLGAASVIALVDGDDVLGMFAANGPTKLLLGAAAALLIILSLLPRVGGGKKKDDDHIEPRRERVGEREREPRRERVVEREPQRVERSEPVARRDDGDRQGQRVVASRDDSGPDSDYERGLRDAQRGDGPGSSTGARSPGDRR